MEITARPQFESWTDTFIDAQDVTERSKRSYRQGLNRFFRWCTEQGLDPQHATRTDILRYKTSLSGCSQYTVSFYVTVIRKFYQLVEDSTPGYRSPVRGVKGGKINSRVYCKDSLTKGQIKGLLKAVDGNRRDRALVMLMVYNGLRTVEVARANIEDLRNQGDKEVLWIQGKGHAEKDDFVVLAPEVVKALRSYLRTRRGKKPDDPLFVNEMKNGVRRLHTGSISWIVKSYLRRIGIDDPRITAHSLRHSTATLAYYAGVPLEGIQALMRHSQITTTMKYIHTIKKTESDTEAMVAQYIAA